MSSKGLKLKSLDNFKNEKQPNYLLSKYIKGQNWSTKNSKDISQRPQSVLSSTNNLIDRKAKSRQQSITNQTQQIQLQQQKLSSIITKIKQTQTNSQRKTSKYQTENRKNGNKPLKKLEFDLNLCKGIRNNKSSKKLSKSVLGQYDDQNTSIETSPIFINSSQFNISELKPVEKKKALRKVESLEMKLGNLKQKANDLSYQVNLEKIKSQMNSPQQMIQQQSPVLSTSNTSHKFINSTQISIQQSPQSVNQKQPCYLSVKQTKQNNISFQNQNTQDKPNNTGLYKEDKIQKQQEILNQSSQGKSQQSFNQISTVQNAKLKSESNDCAIQNEMINIDTRNFGNSIQIDQINLKLDQQKQEISELQKLVMSKQESINNLANSSQIYQQHRQEFQNIFSHSLENIKSQQKENKQPLSLKLHEQEIDNLKELVADYESNVKSLVQEYESIIHSLQEQLDIQNQINKKLKNKNECYQYQSNSLDLEKSQFTDQIAQKDNQILNFQLLIKDLELQITKYKQKYKSQKKVLKEESTKLEYHLQEENKFHVKLEDINIKLENTNQKLLNQQLVLEQNQIQQQQIIELERMMQDMNKENQELREQLQQFKIKCKYLKEQLEDSESQLSKFRVRISGFQEEKKLQDTKFAKVAQIVQDQIQKQT